MFVSEYMWRTTAACEHFMLFIIVMTIVDLSKTLTSLMLEAQQRVERYGTTDVITVETINGWLELYQELYIISLTSTIVQYICLVYYFICFNIPKTREQLKYHEYFRVWFIVISYLLVMILPIMAIQMASNQWAKCRRVMARLHNTMIDDIDAANRKMIKQFICVIKKHPLQIRFMSKVPLGIFLLPAIITLVVNNVIIMLQFNHLWFIVIVYTIVMILPIVAAQMASDQWAKCQRVMARLHNSMIDDAGTAERKMIKQFIRVIKKHPLQIRFISKVPVGIFFLPAILTVVVNNVIILLQFNHGSKHAKMIFNGKK
ncbi:hypothetical protein HW555_013232 [Spodoptera exigua]|uniref:Gustatory receptor n=1 Tax=Spodoptera exigua TaxID=7107 RepID=A0A835G612_SPOEX|nr:hypothetical protein HW555_013232 [Spodoptera exigua]